MLNSMLKKFSLALNQRKFRRYLRLIHDTLPLELGTDAFTVLSMVHSRDVESYLLALKSFCQFLHPRRVVVVMDPSITNADREVIERHVPGVELVPAQNFREQGMPQGGCWERLIAISDYVQNDYVIQLDADTVALGDMIEVRNSIADSCSFVLATEDGQDFESCVGAANWAKPRVQAGEHVQILAEANLDRLAGADALRYVRGCAGFSGFAVGSFNRAKLRELSNAMEIFLKDKWSAWGTEQFASNFMVSNSPKAQVLPHPKYCHPGREKAETVFLHFIGYVRFNTDRYAQVTRRVCNALGLS